MRRSLPQGPIALVEVQGYAFAAFRAMAELRGCGATTSCAQWDVRAERMRAAVEAKFWMEIEGSTASRWMATGAVRGALEQSGHLLYCGLPSADARRSVAQR
jgi:glycogen debranching enzyme